MSDPLRIALVAEGATERDVIDAALRAILAPRSFVLTQLQPEATRPDMGNGWGGVLKWCHQLAQRSQPNGGSVEADPTLSAFDGVVLQLDADVATFSYGDLGSFYTAEATAQKGWQPLPCPTACPPVPVPQDPLYSVLLSWLHPATPGAKTVVCIPAMNSGAWQAAAKLPAAHVLLESLECRDIETQLQNLPLALRVDKRNRKSRLSAADAVAERWSDVTARCTRAQAFDQDTRSAFL